jgi:IS5 family transposase
MLKKKEPDFTFVDAGLIHTAKKWDEHWLKKVLDTVNWKPFDKIFRELYSRDEGRPAWEPVKLFRCLLLADWYTLSDRDLEEALTFRIDFRKFTEIPLDEPGPDATTFVVFRRRIQHYSEKLLRIINRQLEAAGYSINKAVAVDATLVEAQSRPKRNYNNGETNEGDDEAAWRGFPAKKKVDDEGNEVQTRKPPLFGYKINMATSVGQGFISSFTVCPANEHESTHLAELLSSQTTVVYGDKGYAGRRGELEKRDILDGIQSKGVRGKPLTRKEIERNKSITKKRRIAESVFGGLKQWYCWNKARFLGLARNRLAVGITSVAWNMKKWIRYA